MSDSIGPDEVFQQRMFAWAMAYSLAGNKPLTKDIPAEAQKWKGLALTKKKNNCYDDTHYTSGTIDKVNERMQMVLDFFLLSL